MHGVEELPGGAFPVKFTTTVWLKSMTNLSIDMYLLRQYRSNFAYLSDFYILVIVLQKSEISAKNIKKRKTRCISMKFAHF